MLMPPTEGEETNSSACCATVLSRFLFFKMFFCVDSLSISWTTYFVLFFFSLFFIVDALKLVRPKTEFSDISDLPYQL